MQRNSMFAEDGQNIQVALTALTKDRLTFIGRQHELLVVTIRELETQLLENLIPPDSLDDLKKTERDSHGSPMSKSDVIKQREEKYNSIVHKISSAIVEYRDTALQDCEGVYRGSSYSVFDKMGSHDSWKFSKIASQDVNNHIDAILTDLEKLTITAKENVNKRAIAALNPPKVQVNLRMRRKCAIL